MKPTTIAAIYFLLWFLSLFLVLPFGVRTAEEAGVEKVPGQADSAPAHFDAWKIVRRTSLLAAAFFALFYLNYTYEWVTIRSFDGFYHPPQNALD
jgi:predicted secreted protein